MAGQTRGGRQDSAGSARGYRDTIPGDHIVNSRDIALWSEHEARKIVLDLIAQNSDRTGLAMPDILSRSRRTDHVQARQWVMTEAALRGCTRPQIGRVFDLDQSTVTHGIQVETARRDRMAETYAVLMFKSVRT
jgi:chromosomal replication initiation ATPase DnaA